MEFMYSAQKYAGTTHCGNSLKATMSCAALWRVELYNTESRSALMRMRLQEMTTDPPSTNQTNRSLWALLTYVDEQKQKFQTLVSKRLLGGQFD